MNKLALTLIIIGALNWGILSIAGIDLVGWIFGGQTTIISRVIFGLVGLAGVWAFTFYTKLPNTNDVTTKHN